VVTYPQSLLRRKAMLHEIPAFKKQKTTQIRNACVLLAG